MSVNFYLKLQELVMYVLNVPLDVYGVKTHQIMVDVIYVAILTIYWMTHLMFARIDLDLI